MTDGGIQEGLSVWATINIKGPGGKMTPDELKAVMAKIRGILGPVDGNVVHAVKISTNDDGEMPDVTISMKKSKSGG